MNIPKMTPISVFDDFGPQDDIDQFDLDIDELNSAFDTMGEKNSSCEETSGEWLTVEPNDIIWVRVDVPDDMPALKCKHHFQSCKRVLEEVFPNNKILITSHSVDITIIKRPAI